MTYEQASEYKKEHENIVGYPCQLKRIPHYIKALFIAPQEIGFEERMKVLNENWYKPIDKRLPSGGNSISPPAAILNRCHPSFTTSLTISPS